jgi:streptogramin lyase
MFNRYRSLLGAIILSVVLFSLNSPLRAGPLLYVSQYTDGAGSGLGVESVDATGAASPFATFNPTGFASQMAFDGFGNILVANTHQGNILKVRPGGSVSVFATGLGLPVGLVRANDGSFFYASNAGGNSIDKVSLTGVVTPFVSLPAGSFPQWLTLDTAGNLYVSNTVAGNIDKISPTGTSTTLASGIDEPEGLAFDSSGNLFVADYLGGEIDEVTSQGLLIPFVSGLPGNPTDIVFDQTGDLFVSLNPQNEILEISPLGVVSTFSTGIFGADGLLLATPEPSSLTLVGTSLVILRGYCWRRRKLARQRCQSCL